MEVYLRFWQKDDCADLYDLGKDVILRRNWKDGYLYPDTWAHAQTCIDFYRSKDSERFLIYAIVWMRHVCGWIQAERMQARTVEISYWLGSRYTKKGIMQEAVLQCIQLIYQTWGQVLIYARVDSHNEASMNVLRRLHFHQNHIDEQTERFYLL